MEKELQVIYEQVMNHPFFVPAVIIVFAVICIAVIVRKEKGTRGVLEGAAKLAIVKAKERGLTVEQIYEETVAKATETIEKRIADKNVYRRLLGKCAIAWIKSKYIKGVITDFIRAKVQEIEK